jgi:hypothetical protein
MFGLGLDSDPINIEADALDMDGVILKRQLYAAPQGDCAGLDCLPHGHYVGKNTIHPQQ